MTKMPKAAPRTAATALFSRFAVVLFAGTSVLAVAPVAAQTAEPAPAEVQTDDNSIVVTGFKLQNQLAIAAKRDSDTTADFLAADEINRQPDYNIADAFRRAPGVFAIFDEDEGRYVGIRGLNPTRSSKVLLLEDGIPLSFAPYGDNASYYHPPIERFSSLEVLKGAAQVRFGPQTIGGAINYITPEVPDALTARATGGAFCILTGIILVELKPIGNESHPHS